MDDSQLQDYDKLIDLVYATSTNSDLWPNLLDGLDKHAEQHQGKSNVFIAKHIERSTNLASQHDVLKHENTLLMSIINRLPIGVIVVQNNAKVVAINDRAQNLLAKNKSLCIRNNTLQAYSEKESQRLNTCIHEQTQHHTCSGKPHTIQKDKKVTPLSLWISPSSYDLPNHQNLVSIYIASSEIRLSLSIDTLMSMYQLTPTEAKFTQVISNGCHNIRDAAKASDISYETARTYIKRIFQKTNTHNQTELIKLLLTSPAALVGEAQKPKAQILQKNSNHKLNNASCITLLDGRKLDYSEYGDPMGYPVLFFHSTTGSKLEADYKPETLQTHNIRIISICRPGYGNSTPCPTRNHLSWSKDVSHLLDKLNIQSCAILSNATGSNYGLACCQALPTRISHLCIVASAGLPFDKSNIQFYKAKGLSNSIMRLALFAPAALEHTIYLTHKIFSPNIDEFWKANDSKYCEHDKQAIQKYKILFKKSFFYGTQQGIREIAREASLFIKPWEVDTTAIQAPISIWHGSKDPYLALESHQHMIKQLPTATVHTLQNEGFYILYKDWDNIITDLANNIAHHK